MRNDTSTCDFHSLESKKSLTAQITRIITAMKNLEQIGDQQSRRFQFVRESMLY